MLVSYSDTELPSDSHINIMEAVVWSTNFGDKFKGCIHFILHRSMALLPVSPGEKLGTRSKGIFTCSAEGMPVSNGKTHVFFHGFSCNHFVLIIEFKSQRIIRIPAFKLDLPDSREILFFT